MRSKIAKRIQEETPEGVRIFVHQYTDIVVRINQILRAKGSLVKRIVFVTSCALLAWAVVEQIYFSPLAAIITFLAVAGGFVPFFLNSRPWSDNDD